MVPIFRSGVEAWASALENVLFWFAKAFCVYLASVFYLIYINYRLFLPILFFTIFSFVWAYFVNKKAQIYRNKRINAEDKTLTRIVLVVMEKITILFSSTYREEVNKVMDYCEEARYH